MVSANLASQWIHSRDAIWVQDFGLLPEEGRPVSYTFGRSLRKFCEAIGVPQATLDQILRRVCFDKAGADLVPSVPLAVQKAAVKRAQGQGLWDDDEQGHICLRRVRTDEIPTTSASNTYARRYIF